MDPQSVAFVPHHTESWRLYNDLLRLQQVQSEHSDRLLRLERRQDDDARMKSVWGVGGQSPFPSVLSGTPQQQPLHHLKDDFDDDDDSQNLIGSLHLDPDDEPRRLGATSRANSVRFDESANQGHWAHASRPSIDFIPRSASSMGGIGMTERTSSHKSDGRASSVHSVRSAASGRASSLNLDSGYSMVDSTRSPLDTPAIAPGLLILGPVPAIVRCWMNTNFKHDALLYAAVSTASYKSQVHLRLVQQLGFEHCIVESISGGKLIELPVYFAEAVPLPVSSRSSSPAPQVPSVTIEFNVVESACADLDSKAIQIFIGSDLLRSHNADVLFSSNSMTLYDDDQCKLSIPLARPENEATFNSLNTSASAPDVTSETLTQKSRPHLNGLGWAEQDAAAPGSDPESEGMPHCPRLTDESMPCIEKPAPSESSSKQQPSPIQKPTHPESKPSPPPPLQTTQASPAQPAPSPSIWSNWRRETNQNNALDPSQQQTSKETGYQRKDTGIKVLRPSRGVSRTFSGASVASSSSPVESNGKSRFFDDGRKRGVDSGNGGGGERKEGGDVVAGASGKNRANPVGGATAFSWLHSGKG